MARSAIPRFCITEVIFVMDICLIEDWNKHEANCRRSERGEERKNLKNMARVKNEISSNFIY